MDKITFFEAKNFVRASIDELAEPSDMLVDEILDDRNLHLTVKHILPEAFNTIILNAPSNMLEGLNDLGALDCTINKGEIQYLSIEPDFQNEDDEFLRLASFRAHGSDVVVTDCVDEASPVGRMQLNKYVCGTPDNPVLVKVHGNHTNPSFRYYMPVNGSSQVDEFTFIKKAKELNDDDEAIDCPSMLKTAVLDYLVGLVLQTYGENDKASIFITRATDMLK